MVVGSTSTTPPSSTISSYEVVKLLKQPDNRLCADCSHPLTQASSTFASLIYGVWICHACAEVHRHHLPLNIDDQDKVKRLLNHNQPIPQLGGPVVVKCSTDEWKNHEISLMIQAHSNIQVNKLFERYLPLAWEKINSSSTLEERQQWIQAKYYSRYFMIPQEIMNKEDQQGGSSKKKKRKTKQDRKDRIENLAVLPSRLVDYFIVLGHGKLKLSTPGGSGGNKHGTSTARMTEVDKKNIESGGLLPEKIEDWHFQIDTQDCYPEKDSHEDTPIPELLGPMVFPNGLSLSTQEKSPYCFSFVLTDINRIKLYATTLIFYELVDPEKIIAMNTTGTGTTTHHQQQLKEEMQQHIRNNPVLYAPKALTILSHYGFYHLFSLFLNQFYHLSLSQSNIPLERYLLNFMEEIPLPPQGRIEVSYSLPEYTIHLSRPPKNQLPMIDFSYRPLFATLQVDTILTIFRALCLEMTICICCSNVALLTPIQEALLSLLYPLVWQGCYVPILPRHMIELLDAPVPLLVGLHDSYLYDTPREYLPQNVIFVHVDKDEIIFEEDSMDLPITSRLLNPSLQIPKSKYDKLRQKLNEYGSCIYRKDMSWVKAGYPFPHNEHLIPLKGFHGDGGGGPGGIGGGGLSGGRDVLTHTGTAGLFSTQQLASSLSKLGIRRQSTAVPSGAAGASNAASSSASSKDSPNSATIAPSTASTMSTTSGYKKLMGGSNANNANANKASNHQSEAVPYRHPVACTLVLATTKVRPATNTGTAALNGNKDLLDPENNYDGQDSPGHFNAKEIREAFLRFFVASFIDYQNYLKTPSANNNNQEENDSLFDSDAFVASLQDEFLTQLVRSQMFTNFISERQENGGNEQPEIRFFDENILAKKNRSKLVLAKSSTPFLSDDSDYLRELYTVPPPSTTGLSAEESSKGYAYHAFPSPLQCRLPRHSQVIRKARVLTIQVEKKRLQDRHNKAMSYLEQQMALLHQYNTLSGRADLDGEIEGGGDGVDRSSTLSVNPQQQVSFLDYSLHRYHKIEKSISALQRYYRYTRPCRKHFLAMKQAIRQIWWFYLRRRTIKRAKYRHFLQQIVKIQTRFRTYCWQKRLLRFKRVVVRLQSRFRTQRVSRRYHVLRQRLILYQARYRGYAIREKQRKHYFVKERERYKVQLLYLWQLEHRMMKERALFWFHLTLSPSLSASASSFANKSSSGMRWTQIAFFQDELQRVYRSLGLYPRSNGSKPTSSGSSSEVLAPIPGFDKMTFDQQFEVVNALPVLQTMKSILAKHTIKSTVAWKDLVPAMTTAIENASPKTSGGSTSSGGTSKPLPASLAAPTTHYQQQQEEQALSLQKRAEQEKQEREDFYSVLQTFFSSTAVSASPGLKQQEERWFELFQIQQHKYRKRKVSRYLWMYHGNPNAGNDEHDFMFANISCRLVLTLLYADKLSIPSVSSNQAFASDTELLKVSQDWFEERRRERMSRHTVETVRGFVKIISQLKAENRSLKNSLQQAVNSNKSVLDGKAKEKEKKNMRAKVDDKRLQRQHSAQRGQTKVAWK